MIKRELYMSRIRPFIGTELVKVMTGIRRCGKSVMLELIKHELTESGVSPTQFVSINFEDMSYSHLQTAQALHDEITKRAKEIDGKVYLFFDEIQEVKDWEKCINSFRVSLDCDIYITGSNAYMLSGELATLLSGRYITIDMLPLSFREYLEACDTRETNSKDQFNDYIRFGSFPYVSMLNRTDTIITPYLDGIYNTILVKDVARREGITDIPLLESIVKCVASSIGSPISIKKISDTLNSSGRSISVNTVDNYLRALTDSYIFYKADRYDIKGRQHLKTLGKYYMVDTGLRNLLLAGSASDTGHLIENIVYLELLRRGNKVNIGKLAEKEVDFVARYSEGMAYYQVSSTVLDENTLKRELEPLQRIPDNHPKFLLTLDEIGAGANHDGIRQLNLIDWLLGK